MNPRLELVTAETKRRPKPYDPAAGRRGLAAMRESLMRAALRYVADGKSRAEQKDRLREASDLAGIPRVLLEAAFDKQQREVKS